MILQEYIEVITPKVLKVETHKTLDLYIVEFQDSTIVCSTFYHKGRKTVLIKSVKDENAGIIYENTQYAYLGHIHEIGVICLDLCGTPFFEWGELYKINRYLKSEWEKDGFRLSMENGRKVIRHATGTDFYVKDIHGNFLRMYLQEIHDRVEQYKRLGIPLSIPEWVLVNVSDKGYDYRPLKEVLAAERLGDCKKYHNLLVGE